MAGSPSPNDPGRFQPKPPRAVAEAAAQADQLQRELINGPPQDPQEQPASAPQEPIPAQQAPSPQPAPESPQQPPQPAGERTYTEREFKALQGRLDRANQTVSDLNDRVAGMERLLAQMPQPGAAPPPNAADKPPSAELITEKDREEFGDILDLADRVARQRYEPTINELRSTVSELQNRVNGVSSVVEESSVQQVYRALDATVPDWRDINGSEGYLAWLREIDLYSGQLRGTLLKQAFDRHDAKRVVNFFQGYKSEAAVTDPPQTGTALAMSPAAGPAAGNADPLLSYAAPGRARSAPPQLPADKPIYTAAQVQRFYDDKTRGRWKGREAEAHAIDVDIILAGVEGRIRP